MNDEEWAICPFCNGTKKVLTDTQYEFCWECNEEGTVLSSEVADK